MVNYYPENVRYYLTTILLLSVNLFTTYAQLTDDFSDGDFTASPAWSGNATQFAVNSQVLQLNDPGMAATSYLSTPLALADLDSIEWQIYVRQSFSPSANNNGRVYLVSDQQDVTGSLNGYYLQFGESGSTDAIELFEQTGTASTSVCRATDGLIAASFEVRVKVLRNDLGDWQLWVDYSAGNNFVLEASGNDVTHNTSAYFGLRCLYTASNSTSFYFDDVYAGSYILDTAPPTLLSASAVSATELDVLFDEPVSLSSAQATGNYLVNNGIGTPSSAMRDGSNHALIHLTFSNTFTNGSSYILETNNIADTSSNISGLQTSGFVYFVPSIPQFRDVLINEIFADPSPQIGLPDQEFIELHNRSAQIFDLGGWEISDGTSTGTLPSFVFQPGNYVILCDPADTALFAPFGNVLGVSGFPSLNNSGDNLVLTDGSQQIDYVNYLDDWYRDVIKADGGFSLELINPSIPCSDGSNWIASNATIGGTPGMVNSVYNNVTDTTPPSIVDALVFADDSIKIVFSEALDQTALGSLTILFSNGLGFVESLDNTDLSCLWLEISPALTPGETFTITISGLSDCSGNLMAVEVVEISVPEQGAPGDIILNEILFNPVTGGSDFVEVYNRSQKLISLEGWSLANWQDSVANRAFITDVILIKPGGYRVLTKDSVNIKAVYPSSASGTFVAMSSMPSYNNDSGTVFLLTDNTQISDRFSYDEDMHFALLNSVDGVSLERLDFDRPSAERTNWHSAAEVVGYATPGYLNSQFVATESGGTLTISPETFSPDSDGYQDVVTIHYEFDSPGNVGTLGIYDAHGRLVRWLMRNELLSTDGTISWDGITESNEKAQMGIYIVYLEVFNLTGDVRKFKRTVVLAGRL